MSLQPYDASAINISHRDSNWRQQKGVLSRADRDSNWRQRSEAEDKGPALNILQKNHFQQKPLGSLSGRGNKLARSSSPLLLSDINKHSNKLSNTSFQRTEELQSPYLSIESERSYRQKKLHIELRFYHDRLSEAVEGKDKAKVYKIFNEMVQKNVRLNSATFSLLLTLCARMRNEKEVSDVLLLMNTHGVDYDASIYRTLLNVYAETKNVKRVYEIFDEMQKNKISPSLIAYNTIIKLHVSLGEKAEAFKIFSTMIEKGVKPLDSTYRSLFNLYLKDEKSSHEIFFEMKKNGLKPDMEIYTALMTYYHELYHLEADAQLKIYNGFLRWCVDFKDKKQFFQFYKEMEISGIKPDLTTYQYLLMICLLNNLKTDVVLEEIKEKYGEQGSCEKILPLEIYSIMLEFHRVNKSDKSVIDRYLNELLINGIKAKQMEMVFNSFEVPKGGLERNEDNSQSGYFSYTYRISALVERKDESGVYGVLANMEKNHVVPNNKIITLLFKLYALKRNEQGVDKVNALMKKYSIKHDVYTYTSLLNVYVRSRNVKGVYRVMQEMEDSGIEPNDVTFQSLLVFNRKIGDLKHSLEIVKLMKKKGFIPDIGSYNGILGLCTRKNDRGNFKAVFQDLIEMGLTPSDLTYLYRIKLCFYQEEFAEAYYHLQEFKSTFGKLTFKIYKFLIQYYMEHNGQDWVDYYYQDMLAQGFTEEQIAPIFNPIT